MADFFFNSFKEYIGDGSIDFDDDTFKCALLGDNYTPDSAHSHLGDVDTQETSGTNYSAGGAALTSVTWTLSANGVAGLDAADLQWASASFTARYGVIYSDTGSGDPLVCLIDFTENKTVSSANFTIQWNANGIIALSG